MSTRRHRIATFLTFAAVTTASATTSLPLDAHAAPGACTTADTTLTVFGINDFHGRVNTAAALFTPVEETRAARGEENVLTISQGDDIGASTLTSMILDDAPTLDVLNAAALDVSTVGNHEFDKGWDDLRGRVSDAANFPHLGANVYEKGTTTVAQPLKAYESFERGGVTVAVVGAVTADTPTLVSPAGVAALDFGDPVAAVNRVTAQLLDGDPGNGEADVVLASFHEGAPDGNADPAGGGGHFTSIYNDIDPRVTAIFNGHTHQEYAWTTPSGVPILQARQYGERLARLDVSLDSTGKGVCGVEASIITPPSTPGDSPRIAAIKTIVAEAEKAAAALASREIGTATAAISTPGDGSAKTRDTESPMTNQVAQMFADVLGGGDPDFIGMQNPGGTRDSWDAGPITYGEAAATLPFANSLFTTQLTGAQVKQALEQQWQPDGASRPFLQLGLSSNVSYTYDESLPRGQRVTSVTVGGAPIDESKLYTVGSGSFLIAGGDNFTVVAQGVGTRDTGRADLEAWVSWVEGKGTLSPDYSKRGVAAQAPASAELVAGGTALPFTFGKTPEGALAPQSLDMFLGQGPKVSPALANTTITAYLDDLPVGTGAVVDGVASLEVSLAAGSAVAEGPQMLRFVVEPSGTVIYWPVTVRRAGDSSPSPAPTTPGPPGLPRTGD